MMRESTERQLLLEPEQPATACVIWLHGLGADGFDFEPIVPYLKLPESLAVRFIFPHAEVMPVTVNGGMPMRAWYDILEMNIDRKVDKASLLKSAERIAQLIDEQITAGIPAERIVLAGFSQGGAVAYHAALTFAQPLAGLICLSTYMATAEEIAQTRRKANAGIPVWVGHGEFDEVVALSLGEQALTTLQEMGYTPQWQTYPMGHEVVLEEIEAVGAAITDMLSAA